MKKNNLIVSFNGDEGAGKSTIAKMIAEKLNIPRFYMGQIFRDKAMEKGMTLAEFVKAVEAEQEWEREIDAYVAQLPKKEKSFVIESRTAWHFIPESAKIYLKVDPAEGAKRIFEHLKSANSRNEDLNLDSIEKIVASISKRRKEDDKRYMNLYKIDIRQEENYDIVIDTTDLNIQQVFEKINSFINEKLS